MWPGGPASQRFAILKRVDIFLRIGKPVEAAGSYQATKQQLIRDLLSRIPRLRAFLLAGASFGCARFDVMSGTDTLPAAIATHCGSPL
jgi:hypothetical protein